MVSARARRLGSLGDRLSTEKPVTEVRLGSQVAAKRLNGWGHVLAADARPE